MNDTWYAAWKYIPPQRSLGLTAFLGKITRGFGIYGKYAVFYLSDRRTVSVWKTPAQVFKEINKDYNGSLFSVSIMLFY